MSAAIALDLRPLCELVRAEYDELPGVRLTSVQAQRLWGLDDATCRRLLQRLVDDDFLVRTGENVFCRADQIDGAASLD